MTVEEIKEYCRGKHKSTEEYPFGDVPICYKLNGKILHNYTHMSMIIRLP